MSVAAVPATPPPKRMHQRRPGAGGWAFLAVAVGCVAVLAAGLLSAALGSGSEAVSVEQITLQPTDDAYVSTSAPDRTYDTTLLQASSISGDTTVSYLKFTVPALPGAARAVATRVEFSRVGPPVPETVALSTVGDTPWSERSLTMRNAPAVGAKLNRVTLSQAATRVSIELPSTLRAGVHSFAVTSAATADVALFSSREDGAAGPRLVVSYQLARPPSATIGGGHTSAAVEGPLSDTWVGAAVNERSGDGGRDASIGVFNRSQAVIGPLAFRRSFDSRLPATFADSAARYDAANGVRSFVSWKPPGGDFVGAAQGRYDAQVIQWARSVPRTGVYATSFHEPENDMTGAQFVALQRHLYTVVKGANPSIQWGPVYMSYWWNPAAGGHYIGSPDAWWVGSDYADFTAVDTYSAARPVPLEQDPQFRGWYDYMLGVGKPMLIAEYGQYAVLKGKTADPEMLSLRADVIATDAVWLAREGTIKMWLYWDGYGDQGNWRLEDTASQRAWHNAADAGRRP